MSFWRISIFLTVIGSAYSGYQYYHNIEKAKTDVQELKTTIAQVKESNRQNQLAWTQYEAAQGKAAQVMARREGLLKQKGELQTKLQSLESDFSLLVKTTRDLVDKARADSSGQTFPEIKLEDGRTLREAKIRKFEGTQVSFIHADGIVTVSAELLPLQLRQKFSVGTSDLATEAATLAKTAFSAGGDQNFVGLTLRCPYPLNQTSVPSSLPQGGPVQLVQMFSHKTDDIEVSVTAIRYADGVPLSLDDATAGAVKGVLSMPGMSNPSHQIQPISISGAAANRLSLTARHLGSTVCIEAVYLMRGRQVWFVQTVFSDKSKDARPTANSVLSSIALVPAP